MKRKFSFIFITILLLAFAFTGCKRDHEEIKDYEFAPKQETVVDDNTDVTEPDTTESVDETVTDGDETDNPDDADPADITEPDDTDTEQNEDPEITFTISNLCGVDIGMISILDPYTGEQMDVGMLRNGLSMVITIQWPLDNTTFDFAVYNINGDLVSTSEVDITGVKESVSIVLSGDGNLESVTSNVN